MIRSFWKNSRIELSARISKFPFIYLPLVKLYARNKDYVIDRGTQLVIEGFPRSANTFAVAAFIFAQNIPIKIAHHLHSPAQVIQAVHWGIPTIVLIRAPKDAVISLLIREPFRNLRHALCLYKRFYSSIIQYRHGFIIAPFDEVVNNFGGIVERVNKRFKTSFTPFEPSPKNLEHVHDIIDQMDMSDQKNLVITARTVARPSKEREYLKRIYSREFNKPKIIDAYHRAQGVYNILVYNDGT